MQPWPDLRELLDGLRWAVAGGAAPRAYMPERVTRDLDIVVHLTSGPLGVRPSRNPSFRPSASLTIGGLTALWAAVL